MNPYILSTRNLPNSFAGSGEKKEGERVSVSNDQSSSIRTATKVFTYQPVYQCENITSTSRNIQEPLLTLKRLIRGQSNQSDIVL
jgi:uncharacterized protein (DUF924 family)